jgi:hypothetical protein
MSTATLTAVLLDPDLSSKGEQEAKRLSSEAAAETKGAIEALNARIVFETRSKESRPSRNSRLESAA